MKMLIEMIMYLLCLGNNPLEHKGPSSSDATASDWAKVGMDIKKAMQAYEQ